MLMKIKFLMEEKFNRGRTCQPTVCPKPSQGNKTWEKDLKKSYIKILFCFCVHFGIYATIF